MAGNVFTNKVNANQLGSPSRPKIRIFDLEGLRDIESKNILSKS